jgi:methionyl-tRNA formyltransferase
VRLIYFGTPDAAVPPLRALVEAGHDVVLVVSGPDRRRGRGSATSPSPVKAAALELDLPVSDDPSDALAVAAELGVVVAFGRILSDDLLAHVPMVNLHFSLLPRWRGAAPVERAILAGDDITGVCVMAVESTLDTGGVYRRLDVAIDDDRSAAELRSQLVEQGSALLVEALAEGLGDPEPQASDGATYAAKLTPDDVHLDWDGPAVDVLRRVRVGGAWTEFRGHRLKVLAARASAGAVAAEPGVLDGVRVACGDGAAVELVTVQPSGKAAMSASDFVNGYRPTADERLGA